MNSNCINVYQKNWAFTSSDSDQPKIRTGSFGPCYVVTFTSGKFSAMAHIDDTTDTNSITSIFNKFLENSVKAKDIKVIVLGGWEGHHESSKYGNKIVTKVKECGVENISLKNMFSKNTPSNLDQLSSMPFSSLLNFYHCGALIDSTKGETFILKTMSQEVEKEQGVQMSEFIKKYGYDVDNLELPLEQIF